MLVGSNDHRGPHRIRAWMPSLAHYCFLDDPRTQRVVCEPNEKNGKIIQVRPRRSLLQQVSLFGLVADAGASSPRTQYLESIGFKRHGSVTFPHKTSALMILDKHDFYALCPF